MYTLVSDDMEASRSSSPGRNNKNLNLLLLCLLWVCGFIAGYFTAAFQKSELSATHFNAHSIGKSSEDIPEYWTASTSNTYWRTFVGSPERITAYKGPPDSYVEAKWTEYWPVPTFWASTKELKFANLAISPQLVQVSRNDSEARYLVMNEATHQLHCLFNIFRATYLDHYHQERLYADQYPSEGHRRVDHCIDVIRQKLECDWDPSLIAFKWTDDGVASSDFSVRHQCRDLHHITDLLNSRKASVPSWKAQE